MPKRQPSKSDRILEKQKIEKDAKTLAELIYDIFKEKKQKGRL